MEEIIGVPTELNRRLLDGELDIAPISSIAYARNADSCGCCRGSASRREGAVDSIQLVTRLPLGACPLGRRHARERHLGRADEGAAARSAEHVPLDEPTPTPSS